MVLKKRLLHYTGLVFFGLLAVIAFAATLLPLIPSKQWFIRIFDYPRLQTFIIAFLALLWYFIFYFRRGGRGYAFALLFFIVVVVQGYNAWPYTPFAPKQVLWSDGEAGDSVTVSLLICNVLQTNNEYGEVIEKINRYKPHLVITTESDSTWQNALRVIEKDFPYRVPVPQSNTYGLHLYSKFPLRQTQVRFLVEKDIPSIRTGMQLASGEWITLFVVHPRPPFPTQASDTRERDAEILLVAREAGKEKGGVIVAGDFNDVAWSETTELFQEVSGFLDPRRGRGFYNTYHVKIPIFRWPLDHIFHSSHFKLRQIERVDKVNSDHFPMYVKLSYEPEEKSAQPAVKQDVETEEEAKKTIQKGKKDGDEK